LSLSNLVLEISYTATIMIENKEDILWVSNMLGHADASMTLQMYAKYRKRDDIKRASFLGAI